MSTSTNNLKKEVRSILCRLLRMPEHEYNKDIDNFIEKMLMLATMEANSLFEVKRRSQQ